MREARAAKAAERAAAKEAAEKNGETAEKAPKEAKKPAAKKKTVKKTLPWMTKTTNKFKKLYPNWQYERLNDSNVEECFQMALKWRNKNGCGEDPEKNSEMCVTLNSLRLYKELDLRGGVLRAEGNVVAFSIGEPVSDDTFVVHIEKAFADVPGAYPMINQQFVEHEVQGFSYVNREEDMGETGLRSAKESYHPIFMVEKGIVTEKGE